eukprot:SAG11_NODE_10160_length_850_cov_9.704394_1_plen_77_part_00
MIPWLGHSPLVLSPGLVSRCGIGPTDVVPQHQYESGLTCAGSMRALVLHVPAANYDLHIPMASRLLIMGSVARNMS